MISPSSSRNISIGTPTLLPCACDWAHLAGCTGGTVLALARTRGRATFPVEISLSETVVDERKYYVAMIRDITERKRFEEELAAEKKSLAVTLGSIGDGVITIDLGGRIVVCNAASETMTGWAANEAVGRLVKEVFQVSVEAERKGNDLAQAPISQRRREDPFYHR